MRKSYNQTPRFIVFLLTIIILSGGLTLWQSAYAQKKKQQETEESFRRPTPTRPIKPTIPDANRYQDDKVFLENADSLFRPGNEFEEKQVVKGNVKFRQGGMWMYCDSAYYFPDRNSLDAFGHVRMEQGDTLFVYADRLYYDGFDKMAKLVDGPSQPDVVMRDKRMTLTTDSLDYDVANERGWYTVGGVLEDGVNTLTSRYGEYIVPEHKAIFRYDVLLVNDKDGYRMITEELDYNTETHIADINTMTRIEGANDTILTTSGTYNTQTDYAELTSRSTIIHRDSNMNVTTLEGDSIIYDKSTRISRAYMFRNLLKNPRPMVLTDTARKMTLIGEYGQYNDSLKEAFSTGYPLLIEYSRTDTLFLRADTILSYMRSVPVWPDSLAGDLTAATRQRLASYNSLDDIAADMNDPAPLLLPRGFPRPGFGLRSEPSEPSRGEAPAVEPDISSSQPDTVLTEENPEKDSEMEAMALPADSLSQTVDTLKINRRRIDALGRDSAYMVTKDFHVAKAIGRARFFKQDMQGIADTMEYQQYDSMLYLIRKPVVWSGERQVAGERINVHLNDSTSDRADLPEGGLVAEHVAEDFYNQLAGRKMTAFFANNELTRLEVDGNVEAILLPMENDSTYNKLISTESSYLTIDMNDKKLERIKMWSEVSGSVIPIFMVKRAQQYLQDFHWYEALRPVRSWYGNRWMWMDDLGEVPDALDTYFKGPPVFKPKNKTAEKLDVGNIRQ